MTTSCDIHFNTSFRSFTSTQNIPIFLSEGFCELYGAGPLQEYVKANLEGVECSYILDGSERVLDGYNQKLKMYDMIDIISAIEEVYAGKFENKSSLTVCLAILKAIVLNSSRHANDLYVMLSFH